MGRERAEAVAGLSARLGLEFRDPELLALALVHPSLVNEKGFSNPTFSNQRLEFLGDAVIGLVIAEALYLNHPDWAEGRLTVARSSLVSGETLTAVAQDIGLGAYLVMGKGEESGGGRERLSNLAAALEAVIGATLLDSGHEAASALSLRLLGDRLEAADGDTGSNAKSALQELIQGRGLATPIYQIVSQSGDPHEMSFIAEVEVDGKVAGRGTGPRKSAAEQAAAASALTRLS